MFHGNVRVAIAGLGEREKGRKQVGIIDEPLAVWRSTLPRTGPTTPSAPDRGQRLATAPISGVGRIRQVYPGREILTPGREEPLQAIDLNERVDHSLAFLLSSSQMGDR